MNYLAHIYLSGESDEIIVGNFIGDFVKGNKYQKYPEKVAFGIQMHRSIDMFTDQHPDVREFVNILKPGYGRYAGIVADVLWIISSHRTGTTTRFIPCDSFRNMPMRYFFPILCCFRSRSNSFFLF